jgi:guanosine-3',5'-bis(diphosphate) 3'-pyrophosphohydrolase
MIGMAATLAREQLRSFFVSSPFAAASFAARAHRSQFRKDGHTPYVAHVFRVALVLQHVFCVNDAEAICIALLHDTIEDTTTDYDDLHKHFGQAVADGVAMLTKDARLPEAERDAVYHRTIQAAPWKVQVCKLADMYDNASDSATMSTEQRQRTMSKLRNYLDELDGHVKPEAINAFEITHAFVQDQAKSE